MAVSSKAVERATGRPPQDWYRLLDAWGEPDHTARARRLQLAGVSGWWSQSITVAYEQERGLRVAGQDRRGTFQVGAQRTFPASLEAVWRALVGPGWLGAKGMGQEGATFVDDAGGQVTVRVVRPRERLRFWREAPGRRIVDVRLERKGAGTVVRCNESGMESQDEREAARARWHAALDRLGASLE